MADIFMNKLFGLKSILILTFVPIVFVAIAMFILGRNMNEILSVITTITLVNLAYGFFFYTITIIEKDELTISYAINPFKKKVKFLLGKVEQIEVRRYSGPGASTSIKIYYDNRIFAFGVPFLRSEQRKFLNEIKTINPKINITVFG